jgi:hypothetical protein
MDSHELLVFLLDKLTKMTAVSSRSTIKDDGLNQDWGCLSTSNTDSNEPFTEEELHQSSSPRLIEDALSSNASPQLKRSLNEKHIRGKLKIKEMSLSNKLGMNPLAAL